MKKYAGLLMMILVGCSSSERSYRTYEAYEDRPMATEQFERGEIPRESRSSFSLADNETYAYSYYQTLCGELSNDNSDCRQAAQEVCGQKKIRVQKNVDGVACQKRSADGRSFSGTCRQVFFTCQ